jgi:hypothetical protein
MGSSREGAMAAVWRVFCSGLLQLDLIEVVWCVVLEELTVSLQPISTCLPSNRRARTETPPRLLRSAES